jgi:hypothetical protein
LSAASTRIGAALACLAVALALAGCGGSGGRLGRSSLAKQADQVRSLAAEGGLLAQDGADGRTTAIFVREHGSYLAGAATTAASSLQRASAKAGLGKQLHTLRTLSAEVRDQLRRLGGASRAEQRDIARKLVDAAAGAAKLAQGLA